jgi:hypothetical protein
MREGGGRGGTRAARAAWAGVLLLVTALAGCADEKTAAPAWKVGQDCAPLVTDTTPAPRVCGEVSRDPTTGATTTAVLVCGPGGTWRIDSICVAGCVDRGDANGPRCLGGPDPTPPPDAGSADEDAPGTGDAPLVGDAPEPGAD